MQKYYFEIDKVVSITISLERPSEYRWAEALPSRPKKFLGFIVGTKPAVAGGFTDYDEEADLNWAYERRKDASYFAQYSWYKVDELNKKITVKPYVEVRLGYKQSISTRFETDSEAQAWVDELIAASDKKFKVIINQ